MSYIVCHAYTLTHVHHYWIHLYLYTHTHTHTHTYKSNTDNLRHNSYNWPTARTINLQCRRRFSRSSRALSPPQTTCHPPPPFDCCMVVSFPVWHGLLPIWCGCTPCKNLEDRTQKYRPIAICKIEKRILKVLRMYYASRSSSCAFWTILGIPNPCSAFGRSGFLTAQHVRVSLPNSTTTCLLARNHENKLSIHKLPHWCHTSHKTVIIITYIYCEKQFFLSVLDFITYIFMTCFYPISRDWIFSIH